MADTVKIAGGVAVGGATGVGLTVAGREAFRQVEMSFDQAVAPREVALLVKENTVTWLQSMQTNLSPERKAELEVVMAERSRVIDGIADTVKNGIPRTPLGPVRLAIGAVVGATVGAALAMLTD